VVSAVVVELKVGWDVAGSYDAACGRMHGWRAAQWPDSPRYQHQLQLAVTHALYSATFGEEAGACIVHATNEGVHIYELETDACHVAACHGAIISAMGVVCRRRV
jgi:hypothetical protein